MNEMDGYRDVFLAESTEFIEAMTDGLLALEREPFDLEPVEVVFRGAHSLKGMAAAMGYEATSELTHAMESVMDRVRKGEMGVDAELIDLMLAAIDVARDTIAAEALGEGEADPAAMIAHLRGVAAQPADTSEEHPAADESGAIVVPAGALLLEVTLEESCVLKGVRAHVVLKRLGQLGDVLSCEPPASALEDERFDRSFAVVLRTDADADTVRNAVLGLSEISSVGVEAVASGADAAGTAEPAPPVPRKQSSAGAQTVRVAIDHLDALVDLVGELVILRARLERLAERDEDPELEAAVEQLHTLVGDLQYEVFQTRMVPVGNVFKRFPRMVRDLARELGKQIDFRMEGEDIELDRTVLDEIADPLVHLLRNSIDHGLETAEERAAAGKPPVGHLLLQASRERDHVAITVTDDGRGIDVDRVWQTAVSRGLVADADRDSCTQADILMLICRPGFSTTEVATAISGRGVGMDVVKDKVERLGGEVAIHSERGRGMRVVLRLPLTVAIIRALLVESAQQVYAIPVTALDEVLAVRDLTVDTVDGRPVALMRDGLVIALHSLDALLAAGNVEPCTPDPDDNVLVIEAGGERRGLVVGQLGARQEIVVKPLAGLLGQSKGFAGATVLGDGRVALIIDPRTVFTLGERP